MSDLNLIDAARVVVSLDLTIRQFEGQPRRPGSTRQKKDQGRLAGALLVWETLTGLPPGEGIQYAKDIIKTVEGL